MADVTASSIATTNTPENAISCVTTSDCSNLTNAICDPDKRTCICDSNLPVLIHSIQECVKSVALNKTCLYEDQCLYEEKFSTCSLTKKICLCISGYRMKEFPDVGVNCVTASSKSGNVNVDPAMIGILVALVLMFVIICVVLRLFSRARFRDNRSIFNTPNPRLMNASLFKDSKLLTPAHGERRGSKASSTRRPPSRTPSITSVNKDGAGRPKNGSLAKGRRGSTLSTASATGSAAGRAARTRSPSPTPREKTPDETTIAIAAVD